MPDPDQTSLSATAWRRIAGLRWPRAYETDESTAARLRARQLQAVLRLTPLAMTANLLNIVLVVVATHASGTPPWLLVWAAVIGSVTLSGLWRWHRGRARPARDTASEQALRRATSNAAVMSLLWAVMPVVLFPSASPELQLLTAIVVIGMTCAGSFALATVPVAGTVYVAILGLGAGVALWRSSLALAPVIGGLLAIYSAILIAGVWTTARLFGARLIAEAEAERQNEVIGLLLRDFEENASDVLWEVGVDGRMRHVSHRLAEQFGRPAAVLAQQPMLELLASLAPDDDEAQLRLAELRGRLRQGEPFRDQLIATRRATQTRWWTLSAKPLRDERGRLSGWRGVASDVTAARRANRQLSWLAHNDALTGLANRHQFRTLLADLLAAGDDAPPLAVLYLDLDHFKNVNDSLGHATGDALLRAVGERLLAATRRGDTVARLAGDEFAVLTHAHQVDEITLLSRRLLDALRAPVELDGLRVGTRASIGVAIAPQDGRDVDTLMIHADLALYAAKSAGRNEVRFFTTEMAQSTRRRAQLEQSLRQATTDGSLRLVFQPQLTFADWRVVGFEALLRWRHPALGEVPPSEFVPVAEEAGLMPAIGNWVLDEACRQAARWPDDITVSVNVSPVQAMVGDFAPRVRAAAQAAGLPLERLELEITESLFLQESSITADALRALRDAGVRLALDDFGTGYSALSYLRRLPLDTLKIDRSFVRELSARGEAREIVRMIVGLARTLKMRTVAEGVEEPAHAAILARDGCDLLQGWLASRAVEADEVAGLLAGWSGRARPAFELPASSRLPSALPSL